MHLVGERAAAGRDRLEMAARAAHPVPSSSAQEVSAVTDMRHEESTTVMAPPPKRSALVWWLGGGLVVALVALVGVVAWGWTTYGVTSQERAAVQVVNDHIAATNAEDLAALDATIGDAFVWTSYANGVVAAGPMSKQEFLDFAEANGPTYRLEVLGPMTVSSDDFTKITQVSVPTHVDVGSLGASETGTCVYFVHVVDGVPQITQMVWLTLS